MRLSKLLAAALLAAPLLASAADVKGTFDVSAKVLPACTVSATNVVIASYDAGAATATTDTGTISIACTKKTPYTTTLLSQNNWTLKGTAGNTEVLNYQIFQGTSSTPWNGTSGWTASAPSKNAVAYKATVSIAATQDVAIDTYSDVVTVNVNY